MFPADRKALDQPVSIAYDCRGKRTIKTLPNAYKARQFYATKLKQGKNPSVVSVKEDHNGTR